MLDLYLLRHAECEVNNSDVVGGRSNSSPLTERGKRQARVLGVRLGNENIRFNQIYASPAARARHTAEIILSHIGLEQIELTEELLELSQGDWEGKPREHVYTPEVVKQLGYDFMPPNGESQRMVEERMYGLLEREILPFWRNDPCVGWVGHGTAFKCLLRRVLDLNPRNAYKIVLTNASITQLRFTARGWHAVRINDFAHLADVGYLQDNYAK